MNKKMAAVLAVLITVPVWAAPASDNAVFYVYHDKGDHLNHFIPSGWMGDYGDIKLNDADTGNPKDGHTDIKITYSAEAKQGANWAGMYWQNPANNWGDKMGGYDLTGYKRLTFWAKGLRKDKQPVTINELKMGGITGDHGDSDAASIGPITLTTTWKKYTIDLADKNLTNIIGGFCWSTSRDTNPDGFELYLDEIRYEK
jgi:hypothetical protein